MVTRDERPRSRASSWLVVLAAAFAAGAAMRGWILGSRLGVVDSDEAVFGLMTKDLLRGDPDVFFWLSFYAGTQEVFMTAPLFAAVGASVVALKIVPIALYGAASLVVWRVGVRTVGEWPGRLAAALMWLWPPFFVFWTTKRTSYPAALLCGVLALLLALRLHERASRRDAFLLGAVVGCGVWSTPSSLLLTGPAVLWLVVRRVSLVRLAPWVVAGGAIGAAPWLAWNVAHDFQAVLPVQSVAGSESTYAGRFADLFRVVLPEWLGLRLIYTQEWLLPAALGAALTCTFVAALAAAAVRTRRRTELLAFVLVMFPFLYAASSFTYFTDDPRYLVFLTPVAALLVAGAVRFRLLLAAALLAVAGIHSVAYLERLADSGAYPFISQPASIEPLVDELAEHGVDHVFADYWIAYRLTFETDERIVATSTGFVRDARFDAAVRGDPAAAHVFVAGSNADRRARSRLAGYERSTAAGWAVYVRRS